MKRIVLFALIMTMGFSVCFAEEQVIEKHEHKYEIKEVLEGLWDTVDGPKELTNVYLYAFNTTQMKQPLLFYGTEENPKTGFSRLTPEEITQLPNEKILVVTTYDDGQSIYSKEYDDANLRDNLMEFEKLFECELLGDGTIERKIRTMQTSKKDPKNTFGIRVESGEKLIIFEQMSAIIIDDLGPHILVNTNYTGTSFEKIKALFEGSGKSFTRLYWMTNKPSDRVKADQEYIREALLGISSEEEFGYVYSTLYDFFEAYVYKGKDEKYYIRTISPTKEIKKFYGVR